MSIKGISRAKTQQFIGLFAGLAVFVALLTIALITRPSADIQTGENPIASSPVQNIVNSNGQTIGQAKLVLMDRPVAGQKVRVALVAQNVKNWALKNGSTNIPLASIYDIYNTEYKQRITDDDQRKMEAATANQFNSFTLSNLNKPTLKAGGSAFTSPNNWTVPNTPTAITVTTVPDSETPTATTIQKIKTALTSWVNNNKLNVCKIVDLSETKVTDEATLKTAIAGLTDTSVYCADSSKNVVSNLDLYMNAQSEEFVYIKSEKVKEGALQNYTQREIVRHAQLSDIVGPAPQYTMIPESETVKNPYLALPHTAMSKTVLQDIEVSKLSANPNSTSLTVLPEGKILTEFLVDVPNLEQQNKDLEVSIPLKYTVPNQEAKGVQNVGSPFSLMKKKTKTSPQGSQYPYYLGYCYESYSYGTSGMYWCNTTYNAGYSQGEWCSTSLLTPGIISCPLSKAKYRLNAQVDPNNANAFEVDINYTNRLNAAKNFSVSKTLPELKLTYPITIPQKLDEVKVTLSPNTGIINSGDSISATSYLEDQFNNEYVNRVGLTYEWKAIEGASYVTINNATGPDATIIGKNTTTSDATVKITLKVTSGTTPITSAPVTVTVKKTTVVNPSFSSVIVTPSSREMNTAEEQIFTAIAQDDQGRAVTSGITYRWTIGDSSVITASGSTTSDSIKIIAKELTTTKTSTLMVTATDASQFSLNGNATITVKAKPSQVTTTTTGGGVVIPVITMELVPSSLTLIAGNSDRITATAYVNGVPNTTSQVNYTWVSNKPAAEVIGSGRQVTIKANTVTTPTPATITVTATYNNINRSGTVGVTVIPVAPPTTTTTTVTTAPPPPAILDASQTIITPESTSTNPVIVEKGSTQPFTAKPKDQYGKDYLNVTYAWSSSDSPTNITLTSSDGTGMVKANKIGTTSKVTVVITDKDNTANKATKDIYIKIPRRLTTISLSETTSPLTNGKLVKNQTATYKVTAKDQDGVTMNGVAGLSYEWTVGTGNTNLTLTNATTDTVTVKANTVNTNNKLDVIVKSTANQPIEELRTGQTGQPANIDIQVNQTLTSVVMEGNKTSASLNKDASTNFVINAIDENGGKITPKSASNPSGAEFNFTKTDGASNIRIDEISENEIKVTMLDWNKTSKIATNASYNGKTIPSTQSPQLVITSPRQIGSVEVNNANLTLGGANAEITAVVKDTEGGLLTSDLTYTWTKDNNNVSFVGATNSNKVTVKPEAVGTSKITVKVTYNITNTDKEPTNPSTVVVSNQNLTTTTTTTTTAIPGTTTTTTTTAVPTITTTTAVDQAGPDTADGHNTVISYPSSSKFSQLVKNISLKQGWNMLSLPYEATPINLAISKFKGMFNNSIYLPHMYWYNSTINSYVDQYVPTGTIGLGQSSWVYSENNRTADASENVASIKTLSTTQTHAYAIDLNANSWTMVGNPYSIPVQYDDSHVFLKLSNNQMSTISNALASGLVTQAYPIDSNTGTYKILPINNDENGSMSVGLGFWIKTNQQGAKLLISPVALTPSN